jgi:hypothetical protein
MPLRCKALCRASLLIGGVLAASPSHASAQAAATIRIEENFRREPNGVVLARLNPGTSLRVLSSDGNWTRVELEGWVWLRSLRVSDDASFDFVVSLGGGENLRAGPSGRILGRLREGALLTELERNVAWARVSRSGWIWTASLRGQAAGSGDGAPQDANPTTRRVPDEPAARAPGGFTNVGSSGAPILTAPDGDTLARVTPDSDLEVVGREGNWVRVRLEGWMWMPTARESADRGDGSPAALDPSDVVNDPETYAGRVVSWALQFISLERAEAVRTDFFEGEPFLLTRFSGGDGPFVYVTVPKERLADVEGLVPLERISVTGRVRTGASSLTGTPIVELLAIERSREVP